MKKIFFIFLILLSIFTSGYKKTEVHVIDAEKNAFFHNNLGINYLNEHCYYAAIQEFKIAISLSPSTQATAVFLNNIADTYMLIGYPDMALQPYEDAIRQYSLNFLYYQNLVKCYSKLGMIKSKIIQYSKSKNPLNKIMLGLLYIESGDLERGVIVLDEFTMSEPDLLITPAVKQYIKDTVKKINSL